MKTLLTTARFLGLLIADFGNWDNADNENDT
jgi:hypothetical protein